MFNHLGFAVGAILIAATPATIAFADPATGAAPATTTSSAAGAASTGATTAPPNRIICRRVETTGSNLPEHVCKTRSEWQRLADEQDRLNHDNLRRDRPRNCSGTAC